MNEIAVVIDFSPASLHILDFAVRLALRNNSFVTIVWIDNKENRSLLGIASDGELKKTLISKYDELIGDFANIIDALRFELQLINGNPITNIISLVSRLQVNLLLMQFSIESSLFHSKKSSRGLVLQSRVACPIIVFPKDYNRNYYISNILLPIDGSIDTRQKLPISKLFAASFNAKVHLYSMGKPIDRSFVKYIEQSHHYLVKHNIKAEIIKDENADIESINSYCNKVGIDLVINMQYSAADGFIDRFTFTQKLINKINIPLLSVANAQVKKKKLGNR